jgi:hypothetical protein
MVHGKGPEVRLWNFSYIAVYAVLTIGGAVVSCEKRPGAENVDGESIFEAEMMIA